MAASLTVVVSRPVRWAGFQNCHKASTTGEHTISKEADRAALAAMLAKFGQSPTILPAAPMDATLSASRSIAAAPLTRVEKKVAVKAKRAKLPRRNWEAQRRYDEQHGTSNGYDERIEDALAMRRREAGEY